jgi:mono/diheme cytochrome c family protein
VPRLSRVTWIYAALSGAALVLVGVLAVRMAGMAPRPPAAAPALPGRAVMGDAGCLSCHSIGGQGGGLGPPLGSELAARGAAWIEDYITSGKHIDVYPGHGHRVFTRLTAAQAHQIAAYLATLSVSTAYQGHPPETSP